ncbi:MAG: archease [Pirellulales bacterium]
MTYETFDHTADLGLRVRADDLPTLLAEAARGLFSIIVGGLASIQPLKEIQIRVAGTAADYLLFDWLSELLYTFESQRLLLCEFDVSVDGAGLSATCRGEPLDIGRHAPEHEVKAITYHQLTVEQRPDGWFAELIVDI